MIQFKTFRDTLAGVYTEKPRAILSFKYLIENGYLTNDQKGLSANGKFLDIKDATLIVPTTIIKIAAGGFMNCRNLSCVTLPSTLQSIGTYAFAGCFDLQPILILNESCAIEDSIGCEIRYPDPTTDEIAGIYSKENFMPWEEVLDIGLISVSNNEITAVSPEFHNIPEVALYIPGNIHKIGATSFGYCNNLVQVKFVDTIKEVSSKAFVCCDKLAKVDFDKIENFDKNANNSLAKLYNKLFDGVTGEPKKITL